MMARHHFTPAGRHRQQSDHPPFTLVELLVVVAVISLLASMLLPALSRSRDMARRATCANNLKQINLGFTLYSGDADDFLPHAHGRRMGEVMGAWSIPDYTHATAFRYHYAATAYVRDYLTGPVSLARATHHVLRCPANSGPDPASSKANSFPDISGTTKDYQSTYMNYAQAGFVRTDIDSNTPESQAFVLPYRMTHIDSIASRFGFPFLLFGDRVDIRERGDSSSPSNTWWDSNHGKTFSNMGGNSAYHDGHVSWRPYSYRYGSALAGIPGWQASHNDAWSTFQIPADATAWIRNGSRTRLFYGTRQKSAATLPYYNPLIDFAP